MKKDEKEGLIGLAIIAVVLLVGGYFIYKIFFTYGSYAECVGDRTLKPGMSNQQVWAQEDYCRSYFAKETAKKSKERKKQYKDWQTKNKNRIEKIMMEKCRDRFGNWAINSLPIKLDEFFVNCSEYKYLNTNLRKD